MASNVAALTAGITTFAVTRSANFHRPSSPRPFLFQRRIAVIVALSFAVKLFGVLLPPVSAAGTDRFWVPICSAFGLKWVVLDKDGKPAPDKPSPDRPCPFCFAGAGNVSFLPPSTPFLVVPAVLALSLAPAWSTSAPSLCLAARPPPSRAPPPQAALTC